MKVSFSTLMIKMYNAVENVETLMILCFRELSIKYFAGHIEAFRETILPSSVCHSVS